MANDAMDAPRSPSPLPANASAPALQTPGPRAARLAEVYNEALAKTLRTCSYDKFSECFPTPATHTPRVLRNVWEQINGKIAAKGKAEFEDILTERNVVANLNALEAIEAEARGRKQANHDQPVGVPPHELPPDDLLAAHLAPELASVKSLLEAQLHTTQVRNAELATQIRAQRNEIEQIVAGLEATMRDLESANEVLEEAVDHHDESGEGLRNEIKELHAELAPKDLDTMD